MRKPGLNRDKGRLFGQRDNKITKVHIIPLGEGREREGGGGQKKGHICDENRELW